MITLKKTIILISAIGASVTLPASDLTLFGKFKGSLNIMDDPLCGAKDGNSECQSVPNESTDHEGTSFRNNASILGLKGSINKEDLTAYFTYIMRTHNDAIFDEGSLSTIIYQAGLRGSFGDFSVGVGSTPYKISGMKLDPFWDTSASARGFDGPVIGLSDLTWGFSKNIVRWQAPLNNSNWDFEVSSILDDSNQDKHDWNIGMGYRSQSKWKMGLQYLQLSDSHPTAKSLQSGNAIRLWGQLPYEQWTFNASLESLSYDNDSDNNPQTDPKQTHWMLSATHELDSESHIALSIGSSQAEEQRFLDGKGISVGYFNEWLKDFEVYALVSSIDREDNLTATPKRQVIAIGINYAFSAKLSQ